ncbi:MULTISPECIES: Flp pilus assembly protein CpaB [Streptomyces phaeochromogenes group]|uniref:Flp pilus assembly protein CpaB n=1 Tax=Streptomyces phaeochromogenes group TaxID=2838332 RepID=UPI00167C26B5|nr:Flp pilus assembly protein CpaB [Streptomyces umbrinus]MCR3725888.1 pilus assembly protein CpaB [Streptomyces umbrinus]MCX4560581.1 Flp pilus assembly protein CpaB [Streptomyces phaeochromogenes]GHB19088.1 Flp pilus assembly protein CpaB [Streptomyces umbrinus]GHH49615.1 Flp pilus assembly protein CpaB [Streptomyces umbrinus]
MNSRQRRGVILLVLSALCALGAFAGVLSVIRDVNSKVGPEVAAYRLKDDVAPYRELSSDQFEKVSMPERWLSSTAVTNLSEIRGKIAVTRLEKGSLLQRDMIVNRPELEAGQQEIAIMIDAATGVAGKINPGSRVNIYATFKDETDNGKDQSKVIVENARVIDVGKLTALDPGQSSNDRRRTANEAVPITFALDTADAQRVAYAESFAEHVRLALVAGGTDATVAPGDRTYTLDEDK